MCTFTDSLVEQGRQIWRWSISVDGGVVEDGVVRGPRTVALRISAEAKLRHARRVRLRREREAEIAALNDRRLGR